MTCGSVGQKQSLWQKLNESDAQIPRELLAELIEEAEPDSHSVEHLVNSLGNCHLTNDTRPPVLGRSLHEFVEQLPIVR